MQEQNGRVSGARRCATGQEELPVDLQAVSRRESHQLGLDQRLGGQLCRRGRRRQCPRRGPRSRQPKDRRRPRRPGADVRQAAVRQGQRRPFAAGARGDRPRRAAGQGHLEQMPPVRVPLVRRVDQRRSIRAQSRLLDVEVPGRQKRCLATGGDNRVQVRPAVLLPAEADAIALAPEELHAAGQRPVGAARSGLGLPDALALARSRVRDPDRPRLARAIPFVQAVVGAAAGLTKKGNAPSIGGPRRVAVVVQPGRQIDHVPGGEIVHGHEGVIAAPADEGHSRPLRRVDRVPIASGQLQQPGGLGLLVAQWRAPELRALAPQDPNPPAAKPRDRCRRRA